MGRRWPGKTRGAIVFALNFFVSFFFQEKKERQELAVSKHTYNFELYTAHKTAYTILNIFS
jgi:hypothetical protein